jgi:hypothetical protein
MYPGKFAQHAGNPGFKCLRRHAVNKLSRKISGVMFLAPLLVLGLALSIILVPSTNAVPPQDHKSVLPLSPVSTSVLMAKAFHAGLIYPAFSARGTSGPANTLTCSPTPCVIPNMQASNGGQPVNEDPIITNPQSPKYLLSGGNDYNCPTLQGFFGSNDGGSTWHASCLPAIQGGSGLGDPGVAYDITGRFAYAAGIQSSNTQDIVFVVSTDNAATWGTPVVAVKPFFSGGSTDKDWLEVDVMATSAFPNAIYISNTQFDASSDSLITVTHSNDGGKTWVTKAVEPKQIFPGSVDQFSDLAIGKDGTVYVSWQRCPTTGPTGDCGGTKATMMLSKSTDGGNTWSTATTMATVNLSPDSCGGFYGCIPNTGERLSNIPVIAVDDTLGAHNGRLYAAMYNYNTTKKQLLVQVVSSANGGTTWSAPTNVAPAGTKGDEFFQWLNVSGNGAVGVSWLDRRNDPTNLSYEAYGTASSNGAANFGPNLQLTTNPSNPNNDGFGGFFMGDYTGNGWSGNTLFVSWMDTSNGVDSQDQVGGFRK